MNIRILDFIICDILQSLWEV